MMPMMLLSFQLLLSRVSNFEPLYAGTCRPGRLAILPLPGGLVAVGEEGSGFPNEVCCARDRATRGVR